MRASLHPDVHSIGFLHSTMTSCILHTGGCARLMGRTWGSLKPHQSTMHTENLTTALKEPFQIGH